MKLITQIKNIVDKYGGYITMMDLQAGAYPYYKEVGDDIHLVERLMRDEVEIVAYGGYKNFRNKNKRIGRKKYSEIKKNRHKYSWRFILFFSKRLRRCFYNEKNI